MQCSVPYKSEDFFLDRKTERFFMNAFSVGNVDSASKSQIDSVLSKIDKDSLFMSYLRA